MPVNKGATGSTALATIAASLTLADRHILPAAEQALALRHADVLRPFAEAALADARRVAFRDPPPVPRFMA